MYKSTKKLVLDLCFSDFSTFFSAGEGCSDVLLKAFDLASSRLLLLLLFQF